MYKHPWFAGIPWCKRIEQAARELKWFSIDDPYQHFDKPNIKYFQQKHRCGIKGG